MTKNYKDIKLTPLPERELEIIGTITADKMAEMREKALKKFKESLELPGFRKGNAPDLLVAQKVGEMALMEEAAELALSEEYPNILDEHKIDAIGRPEINITKIGIGAPLEFKVKTSLLPEVKLADYRKVASSQQQVAREEIIVTKKEIGDVIQDIRQNLAHEKVHSESLNSSLEFRLSNKSNKASATTVNEHNHRKVEDSDLPEVNDEFAKMIGNFKDVEEMKEKIKENIAIEKKLKAKDKKRTQILEEIMEKFTDTAHFVVIHRKGFPSNAYYGEIGFATTESPSYHLTIKITEAELDVLADKFKISVR